LRLRAAEVAVLSAEETIMRIPKTVSAAKRAANRKNSKGHSTGPKTKRGKDAAKWSAVTYGLFSRDVLLPGESESEFKQLQREIISSNCLVDFRELRRVRRLVWHEWRQRRLERAETGEIAKGIAEFQPKTGMAASAHTPQYLQATAALTKLEEIEEQINSGGDVSQESLDWLRKLPYREEVKLFLGTIELVQSVRAEKVSPPSSPIPIPAEKQPSTGGTSVGTSDEEENFGRDLMLKTFDQLKQAIQQQQLYHGENLMRRTGAERNTLLVPQETQLNRLIKYENHLARKIDSDEYALERMQRLRRGEKVPPPTARID
jgi:hypothetical protein